MTAKPTAEARVHSTPGIKLQKSDSSICTKILKKLVLSINFFSDFRANPPLCSSCMTVKLTAGARVHSTPGIKLQKRDNRIWDCQARFRPFRNMSHKVDIRAAGRPRDMGVSPNQFLMDTLTLFQYYALNVGLSPPFCLTVQELQKNPRVQPSENGLIFTQWYLKEHDF